MMPGKSALLLSGSIGMGHDALAAACSGSLESQGWTTSTLDAIKMMGSVPAQYSPVCTVVTSGTTAGVVAATGVAGLAVAGEVATAGVATVEVPVTLTSPTFRPMPPSSALSSPRLTTPTLALAVVPGAEVSQVSRFPSGL